MSDRSRDWLDQADRDLVLAERAREIGLHEWACFACQQAAEKAVKALHLYLRQEAWGHVVRKLLEELPGTIPVMEEILDCARALDSHYIPTRYANGHAEGAPFHHYGSRQSQEAITDAHTIVDFCRAQMARPE